VGGHLRRPGGPGLQGADRGLPLVHPTGPRFDLFGEIQRYYRLYYDRTPTPTQLKAMLWADANSHSAHYEQFDVS
jgi:hypothetical protein